MKTSTSGSTKASLAKAKVAAALKKLPPSLRSAVVMAAAARRVKAKVARDTYGAADLAAQAAAAEQAQAAETHPAESRYEKTKREYAARKAARETAAATSVAPAATAVPPVAPSVDSVDAELEAALGRLGDVLGSLFGGQANIVPDNTTTGRPVASPGESDRLDGAQGLPLAAGGARQHRAAHGCAVTPSDMEQREGRVIRQGNMLHERKPDKFEVEIVAHSTERTFDAQPDFPREDSAGARD